MKAFQIELCGGSEARLCIGRDCDSPTTKCVA